MSEHDYDNGGYRLPPDPERPTPSPAELQQHERAQSAAARRDRQAAAQRVHPERPTLTAAGRATLRAFARHCWELEQRNRALGASIETGRLFRDRCSQEIRALDLERARSAVLHTAADSRAREHRAQELAALEAQVARLVEDIEASKNEAVSIQRERSALVAVSAPMQQRIDAVCRRLNLTRGALGIDFSLLEHAHLSADITVTR